MANGSPESGGQAAAQGIAQLSPQNTQLAPRSISQPCCECIQGCHVVEFTPHVHDDEQADGECECDEIDVRCVASADFLALCHGIMEASLGPLHEGRGSQVTFEFPRSAAKISRAFLMCYYEVAQRISSAPRSVLGTIVVFTGAAWVKVQRQISVVAFSCPMSQSRKIL
jgi:hypothetical protein